MLRRPPRRVDRIGDALEHGRLRVNVRLFADEPDRRLVTGLLHQALLTVLAAASGLMAVLLLTTGGGPRVTQTVTLFPVPGYGLLALALVLALRVLIVVLARD